MRELIELTASYYPRPADRPQQALELTRTEALADRPYAKLSAGQKRQVQFALAICGRPPLLFLDEPTRRPRRRGARNDVAHDPRADRAGLLDRADDALSGGGGSAGRSRRGAGGRPADRVAAASTRSGRSSRASRSAARATLTADEIRAWPDVVAVTRDTRRLQITVVDAEARRAAAAGGRRDASRSRSPPGRPRRGIHRAHEGGCVMNATLPTRWSQLRHAAPMPIGRILRAYVNEVKYESLRMLRVAGVRDSVPAAAGARLSVLRRHAGRAGGREEPRPSRTTSSRDSRCSP